MNKEEKILEFWEKEDIFHKSIKNREGAPYYSFYDGPPFATGKPHYGHILATTIKDSVLRYWTMKGYQIPRRVGWDCHGLPVENLIEKELNIKSKKEIEELGIEKFNSACRSSVFSCVSDFQEVLKRVGRWADYSESYSTMDNNYIESVWWVLKQLWDKNLVEKNYRVSPYCPRCATTISNFEVNQGYKETRDKSIYVKFKIKGGDFEGSNFLVWTTTPWTLPGNIALAVNENLDYCLVNNNGEKIILAKNRISILEGEVSIIEEFKGKDLIGFEYEPMFDYLLNQNLKNIDRCFKIFAGNTFVTDEDGTGIVHINPMHGEDDFQLSKNNDLTFFHLVDESGIFKSEAKDFAGEFVKSADQNVIDYLKTTNHFYKDELIVHEYPHCWRCDSPLLYYAVDSWYITVTKLKERLISNNQQTHWVPEHLKDGRFGKWLEGARDWDFCRRRYWGAPIPIWQCSECSEHLCIGSIEEIKANQIKEYNLSDLHRPFIDEVKLKCPKCGKEMIIVDEVFDCWFESGSMPYAQWHYPFENKELVEKTFPADFIAEGLDQTRGWFYTLDVLATALTLDDIGLGVGKPAFKNVITNGLVLDDRGRKLSKKLKNYPDPKDIFDKYGADSIRYFLLASTNIGEEYRFSEDKVKEVWRNVILGIDNCFRFYETYIPKDKDISPSTSSTNILDKWIIARIETLNYGINKFMADYDLTKATRLFGGGQSEGGLDAPNGDIRWEDYSIGAFIDDFSNWYIRRSRRRFQKPESEQEIIEAMQTLRYVLLKLVKLIAPFTPFIAEDLYQKLKTTNDPISVHLCDYPEPDTLVLQSEFYIIYSDMIYARDFVARALAKRSEIGIKVRQPLLSVNINPRKDGRVFGSDQEAIFDIIKEEVNVKKILISEEDAKEIIFDTTLTEELKNEGNIRDIIRHIQQLRKEMHLSPQDTINVYYNTEEKLKTLIEDNKNYLVKEVLANEFIYETKLEESKSINLESNTINFNIKVV
ncbi:isoleucine--tRNA ligase [bacterium]|nr:isoleucine--tRNA ligase [bacterium]